MVRAITLRRLTASLVVILPFAALLYAPSPALATPILDSTLAKYAVLANQPVTCVPTCTIGGNVGSSAADTTAAFNFLSGGIDNGGNALLAQTQLTNAVNAVNGSVFPASFGASLLTLQSSLGGSIPPGNYTSTDIVSLTGDITLAGGANPNPVWKFKFDSSFVADPGTNVFVTGTFLANAGIYWTMTQATLNGSTFAGNVMAASAITSDGNTMIMSCGRLLAQTANVTLDHDTISGACEGIGFGSGGFDQGNPAAVPEPSTLLLLATGLIGVAARMRRARPR